MVTFRWQNYRPSNRQVVLLPDQFIGRAIGWWVGSQDPNSSVEQSAGGLGPRATIYRPSNRQVSWVASRQNSLAEQSADELGRKLIPDQRESELRSIYFAERSVK